MDEENQEDELLDQLEDSQEYQESMQDNMDYNYPSPKEQQNQFSWFWRVVKLKDSTKVANLDKTELGSFLMPVREAQRFSSLCGSFNQEDLKKFFAGEAERTLATSMSKKGWFTETSISTKKFTTRSRENSSIPSEGKKWKLFQKKMDTTGTTSQ